MKSTINKIFTLIILITSLTFSQVIDGTYKEISNDGTTYTMELEVKLTSGTSTIGNSVVRFNYDSALFSFPDSPLEGVDYILHSFASGDYYTSLTKSGPGVISINIANFASDGTQLSTEVLTLATIHFGIINTGTPVIEPSKVEFYSPNSTEMWSEGTWEFESSVLPVELGSFTADVGDGFVLLEWETITEVNNSGFYVERSENETVWDTLGFVNGSGNSNSIKDYFYKDESPIYGKAYYRLNQIDLDGTSNLSKIIEVNYDFSTDVDDELVNEYKLYQNYPNPFNPTTQIKYDLPSSGFLDIRVYDILGAEIEELFSGQQNSGKHEISWSANNLSAGVYLLRLSFEGNDGSSKFNDMVKMILLK